MTADAIVGSAKASGPALRLHPPVGMIAWASARADALSSVGSRLLGAQEPELLRALDRVAARRDVELPVHGDRLRLDRVPGDVEPLGHLAERQVAGEQGQQPELC